jgi:hypothetical protein
MTLSLSTLLPMTGLFTLAYSAQLAFLSPMYALSAWFPESLGIAFVILVSIRPMPQAWRWIATLCIAPALSVLVMFVVVRTAMNLPRLDNPSPAMLAPAAFLGFILFVAVLNLLVFERGFPWRGLHWFAWPALGSAVPALADLPGALFLHKLIWFWGLVAILYVHLRSGDQGSADGATRNWV